MTRHLVTLRCIPSNFISLTLRASGKNRIALTQSEAFAQSMDLYFNWTVGFLLPITTSLAFQQRRQVASVCSAGISTQGPLSSQHVLSPQNQTFWMAKLQVGFSDLRRLHNYLFSLCWKSKTTIVILILVYIGSAPIEFTLGHLRCRLSDRHDAAAKRPPDSCMSSESHAKDCQRQRSN